MEATSSDTEGDSGGTNDPPEEGEEERDEQ